MKHKLTIIKKEKVILITLLIMAMVGFCMVAGQVMAATGDVNITEVTGSKPTKLGHERIANGTFDTTTGWTSINTNNQTGNIEINNASTYEVSDATGNVQELNSSLSPYPNTAYTRVSIVPGHKYLLTFKFAARSDTGTNTMFVTLGGPLSGTGYNVIR